MSKPLLLILVAGLWTFICLCAEAQEIDGEETPAASVLNSGQFGLYRLTLPQAPQRHLSLVLNGGYGYFESMGEVAGSHHRMQGGFTVGASPISSLGLSLSINGYRDSHPPDDLGDDSTAVGAPCLLIRGGHRLGNLFELGAEAKVTVPGNNAPSLEFSATSADFLLLSALAPKAKPWMALMSVGYRLDNSDKLVSDPAALRQGDRISLNASKFDAVLIALGAGFHVKRLNLFAEVTADILVGGGAPTNVSPITLAVGGRLAIVSGLEMFLTAEPLLTKRPSISPEDDPAPTPPRFTCNLGLSYTFNFDKEKGASQNEALQSDKQPTAAATPPSTVESPSTTVVEGRVQDEDGNPVGGAEVSLSIKDRELKTVTDALGAYRFDDVPIGTGTLTIEVEGFDPFTQTIDVGSSQRNSPPSVLVRPPLNTATQLKGLIRSVDGTPLRARIAVSPGDITIETDDKGYFLRDLLEGTYTVKISANGYVPQKKTVQIENAGVTILNVDLTPKH